MTEILLNPAYAHLAEAPKRSPKRLAQLAESMIGIVFCWAVGGVALLIPLALAVVPFMLDSKNPGDTNRASLICFSTAVVIGIIHVTLFPTTLRALRRPGPLGIQSSLLSPRWPLLMRPLAAFWWTLMFLFGVWCAVCLEISSYMTPDEIRRLNLPFTDPNPTNPIVVYLATFGLAFAGNTFLMLATGTFTRNERVLRRIWSFRLLIDCFALILPALIERSGVLNRPL